MSAATPAAPAATATAKRLPRRRTRDPRITTQLLVGAAMLIALIAVAVIGPFLVDPKLANVYAVTPRMPPNAEAWLGSDTQGRDLWTVMVLAIPNTLKIGLIAGIFAAVVAARLRHSLDRGRTVRQRLGTTVLGEVPAIRGLRSERHDLLPWLASSPPSELVEAFQAIRTNVEFRLADLDARTIVVTSYQASAGKSTIATGLAWSLAAVGRPALLLAAWRR